MRKVILLITAMSFALVLSGCAGRDAETGRLLKKTKEDANIQHSAPNIKSLEKYAETPLANKLWAYLYAVNTQDFDTINSEYMDPAVNPNAVQLIEEDVAVEKKNVIRNAKKHGSSKAIMFQSIKAVEDILRAPYWEIKDIPDGAHRGWIRADAGVKNQHVNFVPNKFINIIFEKDKQNPDAMRKEIIAALDTFLLKDSGWTKTDDIDRDSYQNAIDWLGVSKRQNEKVIADYGNDQTKSQEIAYLQEGLNKYNNDIAYYQKKIAEIEYPIAMYKYNWKKMFGGMFDFASTISVTIIHDDERIIVAIRQMKNEQ